MNLQVFALIHENEIKNRFECDNFEKANVMARASHGDEAFAIPVDRWGAVIGDKYINGTFVKVESTSEDGTENYVEVPYIPTEREKIDDLQYKLLQSQLVLTDTYEEKLELENKLKTMQQTINKIYERIGG